MAYFKQMTHSENTVPEDVPRTSPFNVPRATRSGVLFWRPGDVLKWHPGDALIWRSIDVPGRMIRDIPRTFSRCSLENIQSTQIWMSQNLFQLFFHNLFDWPNLSKNISTLKVYWEPSQISEMEYLLPN